MYTVRLSTYFSEIISFSRVFYVLQYRKVDKMALLNCFKEFYYDINLNPIQIISRIQSKTLFSNKIRSSRDEFEGLFCGNHFKIHFLLPGNVLVHNSINPEFYGEVCQEENHTRLNIKMRPNINGYLFCLGAFMFVVAELLCLIFFRYVSILFYVVFTIFSLGLLSMFIAISYAKFRDMKTILEGIFEDELI